MAIKLDFSQSLDPVVLLDGHGDYLYRYALLRTREAAIAEELVQETLLAAVRDGSKSADRASERGWLAGLLRQKLRDHFRRSSSPGEPDSVPGNDPLKLDLFETSGEWIGHWRHDQAPVSWEVKTTDPVQSGAFWQAFNRCLADLPRRAVIAFTLREIDGLSSEEICELLSLSQGDLWVMLHCVRAKLRQALAQECFRGQDPRPAKLTGMDVQSLRDAANYPSVAA